MSATSNGATAVNFGFTGTNGITGLATGYMLQSADFTKNADVEETRDAAGNVVNQTFYNFNEEASLEVVITGTGIAAAITNSTIQAPGTIVNITACTSMPDLIASNWVVQPGVKISGSNTSAKKATIPLKKFAGITGVTTA